MAREAILRDTKPLVSRRYTCATGTGIAKGTFLKGADAFTASASTGIGDFFVGFAHADVNMDSDTNFNTETSITSDRGGVYELVASLAITVGDYVKTAGVNCVMPTSGLEPASNAIIIGRALETATVGETINVEVLP